MLAVLLLGTHLPNRYTLEVSYSEGTFYLCVLTKDCIIYHWGQEGIKPTPKSKHFTRKMNTGKYMHMSDYAVYTFFLGMYRNF